MFSIAALQMKEVVLPGISTKEFKGLYFGDNLIGFFGAAFDRFLDTDQELNALLSRLNISKIICLDSRRAYATPRPIDDPSCITYANLLSSYSKIGVTSESSHQQISFDLGDFFHIDDWVTRYTKNPVNVIFKKNFLHALKKGATFKAALNQIPALSDKIDLNSYIAEQHVYVPEDRDSPLPADQERVNNLIFFPDELRINAFLTLVINNYKMGAQQYIHCASGFGRTGYYLLSLIMRLTACNFDTALKFIQENYYAQAVHEVEKYRPDLLTDSASTIISGALFVKIQKTISKCLTLPLPQEYTTLLGNLLANLRLMTDLLEFLTKLEDVKDRFSAASQHDAPTITQCAQQLNDLYNIISSNI